MPWDGVGDAVLDRPISTLTPRLMPKVALSVAVNRHACGSNVVDSQDRCLALAWAATWECVGVSPLPRPHQHLLLFVFLVMAILTGLRWNLKVVLVFICLMAKDIRAHFKMFPSHFHCFFWNVSVQFFSPSLIFFNSLMFSVLCSLYIIETNSNEQLVFPALLFKDTIFPSTNFCVPFSKIR